MTQSASRGQLANWATVWFPPAEVENGELLGGWSCIAASERGINRITLPQRTLKTALAHFGVPVSWQFGWTDTISTAYWQLRQYLSGHRIKFTVPLDLTGLSDFRRKVMIRVSEIPIGQVLSYKQVAMQVGVDNAGRAVGQTMARNPLPLFIPCHRVVGSDGGIGGFSGGIAQKQALMALEGIKMPELACFLGNSIESLSG